MGRRHIAASKFRPYIKIYIIRPLRFVKGVPGPTWRQFRTAQTSGGLACDFRHAGALSLRRLLLSTYAHSVDGQDQITSRQIELARHAAGGSQT
jgi:hypothetical protein